LDESTHINEGMVWFKKTLFCRPLKECVTGDVFNLKNISRIKQIGFVA
jgi:hypothetical protein